MLLIVAGGVVVARVREERAICAIEREKVNANALLRNLQFVHPRTPRAPQQTKGGAPEPPPEDETEKRTPARATGKRRAGRKDARRRPRARPEAPIRGPNRAPPPRGAL